MTAPSETSTCVNCEKPITRHKLPDAQWFHPDTHLCGCYGSPSTGLPSQSVAEPMPLTPDDSLSVADLIASLRAKINELEDALATERSASEVKAKQVEHAIACLTGAWQD